MGNSEVKVLQKLQYARKRGETTKARKQNLCKKFCFDEVGQKGLFLWCEILPLFCFSLISVIAICSIESQAYKVNY